MTENVRHGIQPVELVSEEDEKIFFFTHEYKVTDLCDTFSPGEQ